MSFCPFCGSQLNDGELCTCSEAKAERETGAQLPPDKRPPTPLGGDMFKTRELPLSILLSIVTCGLYRIYWRYCILTDIYTLLGEENTAVVDIVLTIVTCGVFGIYLYYKLGTKLQLIRTKYGLSQKDDSAVFVLLACFYMTLIADIIIQVTLNNDVYPKVTK